MYNRSYGRARGRVHVQSERTTIRDNLQGQVAQWFQQCQSGQVSVRQGRPLRATAAAEAVLGLNTVDDYF